MDVSSMLGLVQAPASPACQVSTLRCCQGFAILHQNSNDIANEYKQNNANALLMAGGKMLRATTSCSLIRNVTLFFQSSARAFKTPNDTDNTLSYFKNSYTTLHKTGLSHLSQVQVNTSPSHGQDYQTVDDQQESQYAARRQFNARKC
eukprot:2772154-Amphidinium_carterae.1